MTPQDGCIAADQLMNDGDGRGAGDAVAAIGGSGAALAEQTAAASSEIHDEPPAARHLTALLQRLAAEWAIEREPGTCV